MHFLFEVLVDLHRNTDCVEHAWYNVYGDKGDAGREGADASALHNILAGAVLYVKEAVVGDIES